MRLVRRLTHLTNQPETPQPARGDDRAGLMQDQAAAASPTGVDAAFEDFEARIRRASVEAEAALLAAGVHSNASHPGLLRSGPGTAHAEHGGSVLLELPTGKGLRQDSAGLLAPVLASAWPRVRAGAARREGVAVAANGAAAAVGPPERQRHARAIIPLRHADTVGSPPPARRVHEEAQAASSEGGAPLRVTAGAGSPGDTVITWRVHGGTLLVQEQEWIDDGPDSPVPVPRAREQQPRPHQGFSPATGAGGVPANLAAAALMRAAGRHDATGPAATAPLSRGGRAPADLAGGSPTATQRRRGRSTGSERRLRSEDRHSAEAVAEAPGTELAPSFGAPDGTGGERIGWGRRHARSLSRSRLRLVGWDRTTPYAASDAGAAHLAVGVARSFLAQQQDSQQTAWTAASVRIQGAHAPATAAQERQLRRSSELDTGSAPVPNAATAREHRAGPVAARWPVSVLRAPVVARHHRSRDHAEESVKPAPSLAASGFAPSSGPWAGDATRRAEPRIAPPTRPSAGTPVGGSFRRSELATNSGQRAKRDSATGFAESLYPRSQSAQTQAAGLGAGWGGSDESLPRFGAGAWSGNGNVTVRVVADGRGTAALAPAARALDAAAREAGEATRPHERSGAVEFLQADSDSGRSGRIRRTGTGGRSGAATGRGRGGSTHAGGSAGRVMPWEESRQRRDW